MKIENSGIVAIIGRPNVGKSTLINALVGQKVSIVSDKPQTTRNRIMAVYNQDGTQVVFLDTPGLHKPRNLFGEHMVNVAYGSLKGVDAVMVLIEPSDFLGKGDQMIFENIKRYTCPVILVINKIDTIKPEALFGVIEKYQGLHNFHEIVPISALTRDGVDILQSMVLKLMPKSPPLFPEDMLTDQPDSFFVAEIIREKILHFLQEEVPHGVFVDVLKFGQREDNVIELIADICCEKENHKAIIIGKGGAMIKKIGQAARQDIELFFDAKVYLETFVKVRENWQNKASLFKNLERQ